MSLPTSTPSHTNPLGGRAALITGAGSGIGRAIALALARAGATTICLSRTQQNLNSLTHEITTTIPSPPPTLGIAADVTSQPSVDAALCLAAEKLGVSISPPIATATATTTTTTAVSSDQRQRSSAQKSRLEAEENDEEDGEQEESGGGGISILVHAAGAARFDALAAASFSFAQWQALLDVNLLAPVRLTTKLLPGMLARGAGTVVSVGSRSAACSMPYASAYSVSKTALLKFHQCLELEVREHQGGGGGGGGSSSGSGAGGGAGGGGVRNFYLQPGNVATRLMEPPQILDVQAAERLPGLRDMYERTAAAAGRTSASVVADACVALAARPDAGVLSGLYIDLEKGNLDEMIEDLKKGAESRIVQEGLYQLKVDQL